MAAGKCPLLKADWALRKSNEKLANAFVPVFLQAGNYFNHEQNSLIFKRKCSKMSTSFDGGFNVTMEFYIKAVEVQ